MDRSCPLFIFHNTSRGHIIFTHLINIVCWFSSFWHFDLVKQVKFAISGHFLENTREEWPQIWHVDVFWRFSEHIYIWFWSWSVDIPHLVPFWPSKTGQIWGFRDFIKKAWGNGLKFDMLLYPDYLWNCVHLGHGLLVFLILVPFWLSETGQMCSFQAFPGQCMGGMGRNLSFHLYFVISPARNKKGKF